MSTRSSNQMEVQVQKVLSGGNQNLIIMMKG